MKGGVISIHSVQLSTICFEARPGRIHYEVYSLDGRRQRRPTSPTLTHPHHDSHPLPLSTYARACSISNNHRRRESSTCRSARGRWGTFEGSAALATGCAGGPGGGGSDGWEAESGSQGGGNTPGAPCVILRTGDRTCGRTSIGLVADGECWRWG